MRQSDCVMFVRAVNVSLIHKALLRRAMFNVAFKYYYKLIFYLPLFCCKKTNWSWVRVQFCSFIIIKYYALIASFNAKHGMGCFIHFFFFFFT